MKGYYIETHARSLQKDSKNKTQAKSTTHE